MYDDLTRRDDPEGAGRLHLPHGVHGEAVDHPEVVVLLGLVAQLGVGVVPAVVGRGNLWRETVEFIGGELFWRWL
jgi:hypothetical protein